LIEFPSATVVDFVQPGFFVRACFPQPLREIQFVDEADLDNTSEGEIWTTVEIRGRSVRLLREKIAELVGYDDFTMCVSAGRHGQFTPLLIDLPRSRETLNIVLLRTNSEGKNPSSSMNVAEFSEQCLCDSEFCFVSVSLILLRQSSTVDFPVFSSLCLLWNLLKM
jgi:hypothetical protein